MSSSKKPISDVISDAIAYTWVGKQRATWANASIQQECYEWLEEAYPDIFAEFKAVHDVSK